MSPKEDAFRAVHKRFYTVYGRMEDTFFFKTCNFLIMMDEYEDRDGKPAWWWPIMVGW
jgi:hypothetical protein